jgi:hypothetical protein
MEFPEKFDNDQQLLISNSLRYVNILPHFLARFLVLENRKQAPRAWGGNFIFFYSWHLCTKSKHTSSSLAKIKNNICGDLQNRPVSVHSFYFGHKVGNLLFRPKWMDGEGLQFPKKKIFLAILDDLF